MCGIIYLQSNTSTSQFHKEGWTGVVQNYNKLHKRGPDRGELRILNDKQVFGFRRLAINGIQGKGDQPFCVFDENGAKIFLMVNGEIYNSLTLHKKYNLPNNTASDCEIILHLYLKFGISQTLFELKGVFAFVLVHGEDVYFGRDLVGVRPLYYQRNNTDLAIASVPEALEGFSLDKTSQVPPGCYISFCPSSNSLYTVKWHTLIIRTWEIIEYGLRLRKLRKVLIDSVKRRLLSERPIGCLLSGGLDSSLIASILTRFINRTQKLKTFSIGFEKNATDLIAARQVASFLGTIHEEIVISQEDAFEAIPEVIKNIGTYDITTVRASVGMFLLAKWISQNTDIKVLFSGEGSDEIFCGYLYFHQAPTDEDINVESMRLINELPYFDILRADRSISSHGLELRVPFLDIDVINSALSIPGHIKHPRNKIEKQFLREAFSKDVSGESFLPDNILNRKKEGFSDGVSNLENPWYKFVQTQVENKVDSAMTINAIAQGIPNPITKEAVYYFHIYHEHFKSTKPPISHFWMPRWQKSSEPSGRVMPAFANQ